MAEAKDRGVAAFERGDAATTFSSDYLTARTRFREAVEHVGWRWEPYGVGSTGPTGEELTIDVASSAQLPTDSLLVISSGLHGVEGFLGSAVQLALLHRWRRDGGPPAGLRCIMLHALNPSGFAWSRRFDADNIDLNRNFLLDGVEYRGSSERYARLNGFLNPRWPPSRWDLFFLKGCWILLRYGKPAIKDAIIAGQHDFPTGLFFGGKGPSRAMQILREHMRSWIGHATTVVHLDFHTGLGSWGTYKILTSRLRPAQREWITRTFGAATHEENDPRGVAYQPRGDLSRWCMAQNFAPTYLFAYAEFGTYTNLRVFAGLRAENQAHHWGRAGEPSTIAAKERLRELFCPASAEWRSQALEQGIDIVDKTVNGILRGGGGSIDRARSG